MKIQDIPVYNDPDGFNDVKAMYPCNTQYMIYNPLLHRYELTNAALIENSIELDEEIQENTDKRNLFLRKVSEAIYNYIQYKAGFGCYQIMMYRIATSPTTIYPDQYFMRKQFEECLLAQARYMAGNGDIREYSGADIEKGTQPNAGIPPEQCFRTNTHISPIAIEILETLNLTRWFRVSQTYNLDLNKY